VYLSSGLQECFVPRGVTNLVFLRKVGVGASREKSGWVLDGFFDCSLPSLKPMPVHLFCELVLTCLLAQSIPKPSTSTPVYNKF
jgi:hypothetical protein